MNTNAEILWLVVSAVLILLGFIGCIVPVLPGPPFAFLGLVILEAFGIVNIDNTLLWNLFGLTILVTALDYLLPSWMVKRAGVSKSAVVGALVGLVVGLFIPPLGIILGPFLGAFIGEFTESGLTSSALKGGCAAWLGILIGMVAKLILTGYMAWIFLKYVSTFEF